MSQKIKIVPEGSGFKGYVLRYDEVVYETSVYKDAGSCSKEISRFVGSNQVTPPPIQRSNRAIPTPFTTATQSPSPARKCCGRS